MHSRSNDVMIKLKTIKIMIESIRLNAWPVSRGYEKQHGGLYSIARQRGKGWNEVKNMGWLVGGRLMEQPKNPHTISCQCFALAFGFPIGFQWESGSRGMAAQRRRTESKDCIWKTRGKNPFENKMASPLKSGFQVLTTHFLNHARWLVVQVTWPDLRHSDWLGVGLVALPSFHHPLIAQWFQEPRDFYRIAGIWRLSRPGRQKA